MILVGFLLSVIYFIFSSSYLSRIGRVMQSIVILYIADKHHIDSPCLQEAGLPATHMPMHLSTILCRVNLRAFHACPKAPCYCSKLSFEYNVMT